MNPLEAETFTNFTDEFGEIDAAVFAVAITLKPRVTNYALRVLGDEAVGQRLLMKACAIVTRRRPQTEIADLPAYLYRIWQRLLLAELEKQNGHRRLEESLTATPPPPTDELDRRILLQQIIGRMDEWTRRVYEYLALDFTYDEIAAELGGNGHALRMKYNRKLAAIAEQLNNKKGGEG